MSVKARAKRNEAYDERRKGGLDAIIREMSEAETNGS